MKVMLKNVRLSFPDLFEAKAINDGKPAYGATFLLAPDSKAAKDIEAAIREVARERWADKADANLKALKAGQKLCLRSGDLKPDYDGYAGNLFVSARNQVRPMVIHRDRSPLTEKDGVIYSGCYVNASIDVWAQDNQFGKRVNASLLAVQFLDDGQPFSGGAKASENDFDDLSDTGGADDDGDSLI